MKITIKSTNIELTSVLRSYIEEKIGGLEKFIPKKGRKDISYIYGKSCFEAWVEVGRISQYHKKGEIFRAEVQIRLPGKSIRAEAIRDDLRIAVNEVKDKLQREFKQYVEKRISQRERGARKMKKQFSFSPLARFRKRERIREQGL